MLVARLRGGIAVLPLWLAVSGGGGAGAAPVPITVSGDPVGPALVMPGDGLCASSAVSQSPALEFPTAPAIYNSGINAFMEAHGADRVTSVMRTIFDLSNNNMQGTKASFGDFTDSMPGICQVGGCDLFINDTTTSFATRFRGFLNVTVDLAARPIHFGFYTDDAVSLLLYDKAGNAYPVVTRPPVLGAPTWRATNTVTFGKPGLYPVEINYVQIVEHAALEMSLHDGPFADFELPANQLGSVSLKDAGFTLLASTSFFETDDGQPPFADPNRCAQCNRMFAGLPGNGGCDPGYYCNEAALCAPCNSALYCGSSCSPCGGDTPFCVNVNAQNVCVQCRLDADCRGGMHCDPSTHACQQCNVDLDCDRGLVCDGHRCSPCATVSSCAGASCNCCAGGASIKCEPLSPGAPPTCIECAANGECPKGKLCDTVNGRCVDSVPDCNTADRCGDQCLKCPGDRPYCLDAAVCVECRSDVDCAAGRFCVSGQCADCAVDRHCGARCASCGGERPFCQSDGTTAHSACVRCRDDRDCVGGRCDKTTHECSAGCAMTCAAGTHCDGVRCVDCYANTHCPCGGSCDVAGGRCALACSDSIDCRPDEHCTHLDHLCKPGRLEPDLQPKGGAFCNCFSAVGGRPRGGGFAGLLLVAALCALRRRGAFLAPARARPPCLPFARSARRPDGSRGAGSGAGADR